MSALRKLVEAAEPGSQVGLQMPREWWMAQLDREASKGNESERWIDLAAAATVMGRKASAVRASAPGWASMPCPPVRVRKKGPAPKSPWLFLEADCWRYRRETGGGPRVAVPTDVAVDERTATVEHWARIAFETTEAAACPASARKTTTAGRSRSASKGSIA